MTDLWKKLNLRDDHTHVTVVAAPASFSAALESLPAGRVSNEVNSPLTFALAFATTQAELDHWSHQIAEAAVGDAVLWFAYPKKSSRTLRCDFDRDHGWTVLGALGWEGVRQVAIDEDWSALRFRRIAYIRSFTRSETMANTAEGKQRAPGRGLPPMA
jgi:hypothetical protein